MRSASASRCAALLATACAPAGCGLLASSPEPPSLAEVNAARRAQAPQWERLEEAAALYLSEGPAVLKALQQMVREHPESLRLEVLVQDVEVELEGYDKVWNRYVQRYGREPSARNAFLAARVAPNRETMLGLVIEALARDPGFVPAQVLRIGLQARIGNPDYLDRLIELLQQNPGSAEGWRLLANLAPLYGRHDLARLAAATEPWSTLESLRRAHLLQAATALNDDDPVAALAALRDYDPEDRDARMLLASSYLRAGRAGLARGVLEQLVEEDPDDPQARFNLGLLYKDYLDQPRKAAEQLRRFLELASAGAPVPYLRRLQAELWLEALEPQPGKRPMLLGAPLPAAGGTGVNEGGR